MLRFKHKIILFLIVFIQLAPYIIGKDSNEEDDADDYQWDYDQDSEVKLNLNKAQILSLTRDWWGRTDPDQYPTNGFFPVWAFSCLAIAGFFFFLTFLCGLLHVLGCKGKRPKQKPAERERKGSVTLLEQTKKNTKSRASNYGSE